MLEVARGYMLHQHVNQVVCSTNLLNLDDLDLSNEVISDINMFCPFVIHMVLRQVDSTLAITKH